MNPSMVRLRSISLRMSLAAGLCFATLAAADPRPAYVTTWGTNPNEYPVAITRSPAGHLHVAYQLFSSQGFVTAYERDGDAVGGTPWFTPTPNGVAVDAAGDIYVSSARCNCVKKFVEPVETWGDTGSAPGEFRSLLRIAIDADGYLYAADRNNRRIQKLLLDGTPVAAWGDSGTGAGQLGQPYAIAVDGTGHVYVTDTQNDKVLKYTTAGAFVAEWGGLGADLGQLDEPTGIAADGHGAIFVADQRNLRIQKFTDAGTWLTSWGEPDSANGLLVDVAADGQGGVYAVNPYSGVLVFLEPSLVDVPSRITPRLELVVGPNPARDRIELRWSQSEAGPAEVTLVDVSGRRVGVLASGAFGAGTHRVSWSAAAGGLRDGIYWVRVRVAGAEAARSLVVLR